MKLAISLGLLHPNAFLETAVEADRLGFESLWLPEHLVFPVEMGGSPFPGAEHPPVPPSTPVFDAFAYLSFLAGCTERIRLGTNVYLLGLRHPFVAARSVLTLDIVSGGRAEVGVGAGWLRQEWTAAGLDPRTRGRRLDEALGVVQRLLSEETVEHHGEFFDFPPVMFEPKPIQKPHPPFLVGGESPAALRRAARLGDGWYGLQHTPASAAAVVKTLTALRTEAGRMGPFAVTVGGEVSDAAELRRFEEAGVDRLVVKPWERSREAVAGLRRFAERFAGELEAP